MAIDYDAIRTENEKRYGTEIGRIGPMLLADRYDDRAHFIYELLQNAEDALRRRGPWEGPRTVTFDLSPSALRVEHYGAPFTEADVRGICGIGESTKDLTSIGRFGIGFKSVYAFTDRPEIHSPPEHFRIRNFVWPEAITPIAIEPGKTVFVLPFKPGDPAALADISSGLYRLGERALLFLRHVEEVTWRSSGELQGRYARSRPETLGAGARKIKLTGAARGAIPVEETWLVFSRPVHAEGGAEVGNVEVAFQIDATGGREGIIPVRDSTLVAFFPTVLSTNVGFLIQGPYRTTPSRDNVPAKNTWNEHLVRVTGEVIVDALRQLRDAGLLDVAALQTLPLDPMLFAAGQRFAPAYLAVREALSREELIPRWRGGHATAARLRLARTQQLRELLDPAQLGALFGGGEELYWVDEAISADRTPQLRQYLMQELGIGEVTPEALTSKLTREFLEAQSDVWTARLYEFLGRQPALTPAIHSVPLVRLDNGTHVTPGEKDGRPQAFLPGKNRTEFPTVKATVCATAESRRFLLSLGLTEPDPVDEVLWNVLTRYEGRIRNVTPEQYAQDIQRILTAFRTDSSSGRERLVEKLRTAKFVRAVRSGDRTKWYAMPGMLYLATQRLKELFDGVPGVLFVDESFECLRGEAARGLLEACGAARTLQAVDFERHFDSEQLTTLRKRAVQSGECQTAHGGATTRIADYTLRGLEPLLSFLQTLESSSAAKKARLLWDALCELHERNGASAFVGTYQWFYSRAHHCSFPARFVELLNSSAWIPDREGVLRRPDAVLFDDLGWKPNSGVLAHIRFRPPVVEALAKEAGLDPNLLVFLKQHGITSEADLKARLGIEDAPAENPPASPPQDDPQRRRADQRVELDRGSVRDSPGESRDDDRAPRSRTDRTAGDRGGRSGLESEDREHSGKPPSHDSPRKKPSRNRGHEEDGTDPGAPPFISYIGARADESERDPDDLEAAARARLEDRAIERIRSEEPALQRTAANNAGFDLFELNADGEPVRWVEVKAMTGTMEGRPVGMSSAQFEMAERKRDAYWLYVVERAGTDDPRIFRIRNPAGRASTYTFDHGWKAVVESAPPPSADAAA